MPSSPALLTAADHLHEFSCGIGTLDDWLKRRALSNQLSGASRTYVVIAAEIVCAKASKLQAISKRWTDPSFRHGLPESKS